MDESRQQLDYVLILVAFLGIVVTVVEARPTPHCGPSSNRAFVQAQMLWMNQGVPTLTCELLKVTGTVLTLLLSTDVALQ